MLLGLTHGHWDEPHTAAKEDTGRAAVNAGIGVVVPAKVIAEVLCEPVFDQHREDKGVRIRDNRHFVTSD
jgi:hypothetical protein